MTKFGSPEQLSDFSDFGRQQVLRDVQRDGESRALCSPDGKHLFLLLPHRLLSFLRLPTEAPLLPASYLEITWTSPQLVGVLFLECSEHPWLLTLVWESGRAEVWSPPRGPFSKGWVLLQTLELCNSARARVVSVCNSGRDLVWCEERPPSGAKALSSSSSTDRPYSYCICQRFLVLHKQQVTLGGMKIVLHHSPLYHLHSTPHHIFMIPDGGTKGIATRLLLVYSHVEEKITMTSISTGLIHSKSLTEAESDFQKMVVEYLGFVTSQTPLNNVCLNVTKSGELLLMDSSRHIYLLSPDGAMRLVCDIDNHPVASDAQIAMQIFDRTLACALDSVLYLIDISTGRLMEKKILNADRLFFLSVFETSAIQFLTKNGIYKISRSSGVMGNFENNVKSEPALVEMIFEEACKYYQRRSLSNTKLTVQSLKTEGVFQAPIMLSSILKYYQKKEKSIDLKYVDLLSTMNNDLESYLSLERLKTCIINVAEEDIEKYCEDLVDQEINRLLHSDLDRESLIYINSLFSLFPEAAWLSVRNNLQFQQNGDGKLVVRATPDMWKKVLGPLPSGSKESSQNGVYPLFEVICQSLYTFKPKWLPMFVKHAQDCLGLSWGFSNKDNCESVPLYKRALSVLSKQKEYTTADQDCDLEVDILLCSGRPLAITQAIHILIGLQQWERVMEETKKFSQLSPVITKDIFVTLLVEFVKRRYLDAYVNQICDICPEDMTATALLRIVLQNLPKTEGDQCPFPSDDGAHFTIGLLKPLLSKVLQNQARIDQKAISPTFLPSPPPRTDKLGADHVFLNGNGLTPEYCPLTDIRTANGL
ncbi:BLOC-2 complex member HPS6 [Spea bombifrons]|uniref:BLOC-2 complex member HPS6 n=1 Tax=Spea bombifrons TaxID=233779 RepID=UPI002349D9E9|nr:BLOC-2 complex member HPS6 [Spea bombifrons]